MKNIIIASLVAIASLCSSALAQAPTSYKVDQLTALSMPTTTITVSMVISKTTIKTGPYARFAQKFLNIVAPLTNKEIYTIGNATLSYFDSNATTNKTSKNINKLSYSRNIQSSDFQLVTADRMIFGVKSPEDLARDAANELFLLRKRRFDLITGEAGENVFGEGLKAAIAEMSRLENEILELFIGKTNVTSEIKTFNITPAIDKQSYIIARFSESDGILSDSDLSGSPIVFSVNVEQTAMANTPKKESKITEYYHIAAITTCKVAYSTTVLATDRIPVLQLGKTVSVGVSK